METALEVGPAAYGWSDRCWTLARIAETVRRRFGAEYTLAGLDPLLHHIAISIALLWTVRPAGAGGGQALVGAYDDEFADELCLAPRARPL